jgi:hypothetical protein
VRTVAAGVVEGAAAAVESLISEGLDTLNTSTPPVRGYHRGAQRQESREAIPQGFPYQRAVVCVP